jgi:hypothetical protein
VLAIVFVLAGGAFAAVTPGVSPWRAAFRASIAVALALAIALDIRRRIPLTLRRRARLAFALVIVELAISLIATAYVDGSVALATLAPLGRAVTVKLDGEGYAFPRPLGEALVAVAPDALVLRDGRLVATSRLADTLHLLGDDPVPALGRMVADRRVREAWRLGRVDACALMRILRPPLDGYRERVYGAAVVSTRRACASR